MDIAWEIVGVVVALLIGTGVNLLGLNPPEYAIAKACFWISAVLLGGTGLLWELRTQQPTWWRISAGVLIWVCVGVGLPEALRWISTRQSSVLLQQSVQVAPQPEPKPNLVFVFGAPLGDNASAEWIMMVKHFGPSSAHNCKVDFYDDDRINIKHEWLVKHPNIPFAPKELAGEFRTQIDVGEVGPEGSTVNFRWRPLYPDSQHYSVNISCRDGVFREHWEITRVNGVLRSKVTIEKNPGKSPLVFEIVDPEFISMPLAIEVPKTAFGKAVHSGWKPNYRFEVPAAIVDSNGNVQVVAGIKQPDGSTLTDFGSWNILTKHFGDDT